MKKNNIYIYIGIFFFLIVFGMAQSTFAAEPTSFPLGKIDAGSIGAGGDSMGTGKSYADETALVSLIMGLVNWFAWIIGLVSVVMGLYSGFLFITARGEAAQVATARKTLLYAVIGIAVAVASFSIITITKAFI